VFLPVIHASKRILQGISGTESRSLIVLAQSVTVRRLVITRGSSHLRQPGVSHKTFCSPFFYPGKQLSTAPPGSDDDRQFRAQRDGRHCHVMGKHPLPRRDGAHSVPVGSNDLAISRERQIDPPTFDRPESGGKKADVGRPRRDWPLPRQISGGDITISRLDSIDHFTSLFSGLD